MNTYTYLRLSVTDQCNFNCFYCRPSLRRYFFKNDEMLSNHEMLTVVGMLSAYGIKHVRVTGGEPVLKKDLPDFLKSLSSIKGLNCLSLTTNGSFFSNMAHVLKESNLEKVNISLDTLKKKRFHELTGVDALAKVRNALLEAKRAGFASVKLNCILIKDFNDDEILDFVDFGFKHGIDVRFIEYFSTRGGCDASQFVFIPSDFVRKTIENKFGSLRYEGCDSHAGPARYYRIPGACARIGFISSVTEFFCGDCNRLRLTSDGKLYPCLHSAYHADLKAPLRENDLARVSQLIKEVFSNKKLYNKFYCSRAIEMSRMGG